MELLSEFWVNFSHNLFKPLLLFFYLGFMSPILGIRLELPAAMYQSLTIYLLLAIGWHGGEELSHLSFDTFNQVLGFMGTGLLTNLLIGFLAYFFLRAFTRLKKVDAATVAGYYGSDSAGTFVTCLGVLATVQIAYDAYMPVMLAVMEIPGCLVALYLVSRMRAKGQLEQPANGLAGDSAAASASGLINIELLKEVFLNPGIFLLFGGIVIGFISGKQGPEVTKADDFFFINMFQGALCLFLLEMGTTAAKRLKDLRHSGWRFVAFGIVAPNVFATLAIVVMHAYSSATGIQFQLGSYVLFAVLCAAASYIAVPAVQRLAIPEASPTLPLAASLGLTFTYNVTVGIPTYILIARSVTKYL